MPRGGSTARVPRSRLHRARSRCRRTARISRSRHRMAFSVISAAGCGCTRRDRVCPSAVGPSAIQQSPMAPHHCGGGAERPIAVSPDGQVVVLAYPDGSARLIPGGTNLPIPPARDRERRTIAMAAAADRYLVPSDTGEPIVDVDFSIDGALIATSGADGTSRLWRNPGRTNGAGPAAFLVVVGGVVEDAARSDDGMPDGERADTFAERAGGRRRGGGGPLRDHLRRQGVCATTTDVVTKGSASPLRLFRERPVVFLDRLTEAVRHLVRS